jgi:hypothetical protein
VPASRKNSLCMFWIPRELVLWWCSLIHCIFLIKEITLEWLSTINPQSSSSFFECISLIKEIHWIIIFLAICLLFRLCKEFLLSRFDCVCTYNIPDESCFFCFLFINFGHMFLICLIHCYHLMIGSAFTMIDYYFYLQLQLFVFWDCMYTTSSIRFLALSLFFIL